MSSEAGPWHARLPVALRNLPLPEGYSLDLADGAPAADGRDTTA